MVVVLPESVSTKIWRYGYFEEDVCLYILHCLREGMTFIDIGSHFGFFTMLGSHLVGKKGKILAFEPTPSTYKKLEENVIDRLNVETFNIAAFSENTEIDFFDYGIKKSAYNSAFGSRSKSLIRENKILVNARKVDDILEERGVKSVDCIKIDAESSEFHVLEGMKKTLRRYKPKIILEVGDFDISGSVNSQEVIKGLQHLNYSAWEASNGKLVPHVMRDQYEYGNLLFSAD